MSVSRRLAIIAGFCLLAARGVTAQNQSSFQQPTVKPAETHAAPRRQASHQKKKKDKDKDKDPARLPANQPAPRSNGDVGNILELDLEQLSQISIAPSLNLEVVSVSRTESTVGKSPAAVFVITNEMIRRSPARTIPEILKMVPGLNVAGMNANTWSVTARGFSGKFANKLLVQIDGRDVYTPLFAGTRWDVQDVLLEDVERIEVIRGPGATVWGENAVNGVISIITKSSKDTQGSFVEAGAGDEWQSFSSARFGGQVSKDAHYRVWGKWFERDARPIAEGFGGDGGDAWRMARGGFRTDWRASSCDQVTAQGEYYDGFSGIHSNAFLFPGPPIPMDESQNLAGGHVLSRWTHTIDSEREWSAQAYFDRHERHSIMPNVFLGNDRNTIDFDFQYRFPLGCRQKIICGFGYRYADDVIRNALTSRILPPRRSWDRFSYFIQDQVTLAEDRWYFTLGSKFSHNEFTGFEMQPSARLLWTPSQRVSVWGAVSRGVRTPSRSERDLI
ncbi:MAG: TonB-dependent receptor, partial [Planctomycetales bacterium]